MKAAVFSKPGIENLRVQEYPEPEIGDHDVLIKVKMAGVNPIDYFTVSGTRGLKGQALPIKVEPLPHIPGSEITGTVERFGKHVERYSKGDRVIAYNRLFDGTCDMCLNSYEMLCRNKIGDGLIGVNTNGGFAEYVSIPEKNLFSVPNSLEWDIAASIPITALTPFHALKEASLRANECLLVFGASGNTGMLAIQLGKKIGSYVVAISGKTWLKDLGADYIITDPEKILDDVDKITDGKLADVVLNAIGNDMWGKSFKVLGSNGRLITFGVLTGNEVKLDVHSLYSKHIRIIGCTSGSRSELQELIGFSKELKIKVWKKFKLEEAKEALQELFAQQREGRILLEIG
jgi:NADPH:quinone reductase-like Zn-dependent oxidoreductase